MFLRFVQSNAAHLNKPSGSISRRLRNSEVWLPLSRPVFLRCVSRRLLPAHRHVSTPARRRSSDINEYRLEHEDPIDILEIDNTAVREQQVARLKDLRAHRDEAAVQAALKEITASVQAWADGGKGENLLALAVRQQVFVPH